jgi:hypothetical protein
MTQAIGNTDDLDTLRFKTIVDIVNNKRMGLQKLPDDIVHDVIKYSQWKIIKELFDGENDYSTENLDDGEFWQEFAIDHLFNSHKSYNDSFRYASSILEFIFPYVTKRLAKEKLFLEDTLYWAILTENDEIIETVLKGCYMNDNPSLADFDVLLPLLDKNVKYAKMFIDGKSELILNSIKNPGIGKTILYRESKFAFRDYADIIADGHKYIINKCEGDKTLIKIFSYKKVWGYESDDNSAA